MSCAFALQEHLDILKSYGFLVPIAFADSDLAFANLNGLYAGTTFDCGTAGAHNNRAGVAIRLIKEVSRSIFTKLQRQYPVPPQFITPLMKNTAF